MNVLIMDIMESLDSDLAFALDEVEVKFNKLVEEIDRENSRTRNRLEEITRILKKERQTDSNTKEVLDLCQMLLVRLDEAMPI